MAPVPSGTYGIDKPNEQLLSLPGVKEHVLLLPPHGGKVEAQSWEVEELDNGNVLLRNQRHRSYAGYYGDPEENSEVVGSSEPREWELRPAGDPDASRFHVVVPGGPVGGTELALDLSVLDIAPQRIALRPLDVRDEQQAWGFLIHLPG
ncbi:hypothetical protein PUR61_04665 [Streptomyces sp. BE20]|uniref:hypothetical protein n=1 Tax=Streptomycetaceae TaxID=2062 RepID=UPI002E75ED2B|nr:MULTISPECIES: hypothetical protein [unclassified Streptomyces]MED7951029.1 hypothetical protein [Streptomyces sp. BE303]MEE1821494.1 hypothetical protein [Streptomyces sp. BE20]